MRFIDEAKITIKAGHGGRGCVSFRRESCAPRGGPDGGDGGAGGDVIFVASQQLGTLQDFRFKRLYQAENGHHGSGANKAGKDGLDVEVRIPVGTIIKNLDTGEVIKDFTIDGERWVACTGGRGGKGNAHFVSSTHQAPKFAQPGEDGTELNISLELKLLADAALVGYPNAGKSTLISRLSAARPKIADYPFTTLVPNLGVVTVRDSTRFVLADIPGLIEGAHKGAGLGHRFLKHIERTRVRVTLLDGEQIVKTVGTEEEKFESLLDQYKTLSKELKLFNKDLMKTPEIVVVSKIDLFQSEPELLAALKTYLKKAIAKASKKKLGDQDLILISSVSSIELETLKNRIEEKIREARTQEVAQAQNEGESSGEDDAFEATDSDSHFENGSISRILSKKSSLPDSQEIRF